MKKAPNNIILDTDMDTDCDDAGALAVLHSYRSRGDASIPGVVCSVPYRQCAACVWAINEAYGRSDIPIGLAVVPEWTTSPRYTRYRKHRERCTDGGTKPLFNDLLARAVADRIPENFCEGATALYRRLLAAAPDGSVTVCAIGTLTALAGLLESSPDEISPLSGAELIAGKVRVLVTMAKAGVPAGKDGFNWAMDLISAAKVLSGWPTDLVVSSTGTEVLTGARLMSGTPSDHPVHRAYRTFLGSPCANRPSWDQLAVVHSVLGASSPFVEDGQPGLFLDPESGVHEWKNVPCAGRRAHLSTTVEPARLAKQVEDLMLEAIVNPGDTPGANR